MIPPKKKLKPLTISSGQVKALLLKLGNDNESVWKPAFEELEYFDPRLAIDLETLMDRYTEAPTRQRMVEVLSAREVGSLKGKNVQLRKFGGPDDFNFFAQNEGSWWAENRVERLNSENWSTNKTNFLPHILRVTESGESLFPGRVIAGIAIINSVAAERGELSSKRSECRVAR